MSNFLVPSSVVCARRKNQNTTNSRPQSGSNSESVGGPLGAGAGAPAVSNPPPGFLVPTATLPHPSIDPEPEPRTPSNNSNWQYTASAYEDDVAPPVPLFDYPSPGASLLPSGILSPSFATPVTPSASPPPPLAGLIDNNSSSCDNALIAFANTDMSLLAQDGQQQQLPSAPLENLFSNNEYADQNQGDKPATPPPSDPETATVAAAADTSSDNISNDLNLRVLVKTIAKENIAGSPFHATLLQQLQNSSDGMTLTQVLSVLLGFPDLLNLFCTIQSQYKVPPNELLLELEHVGVQSNAQTIPNEEEEPLFYYAGPIDSTEIEETSADGTALDFQQNDGVETNTNLQPETAERQGPAGGTNTEHESTEFCLEENQDAREISVVDAAGNPRNHVALSSEAAEAQGNDAVSHHHGFDQQLSSSSTSPTTVTTSASSSMDIEEQHDKNNHVAGGRESHPPSTKKGHGNRDNEELQNSNHAVKPTTAGAEKAEGSPTENITTQEDRNDGHISGENSGDRQKDKDKERDTSGADDEARQIDIEIVPTKMSNETNVSKNIAIHKGASPEEEEKSPASAAESASQQVASPSSAISPSPPKGMPILRPKTTLRPDHQKPPLPYHIRTSADALAALEFLSILRNECEEKTATWPGNQVNLKMYLTKITNCCFSKNAKGDPKEKLPSLFRSWFEAIMKQYKKDPKRLSKIRKTATTNLIEHFVAMECVKTDSDLEWSQRKVDALVKGYQKHQELENPKKGEEKTKKSESSSADADKPQKKPEKVDDKKKAAANLWQNQRKVVALVHGKQPKDTLPQGNQKADLSMVMLKKTSTGRTTWDKSILSAPLPAVPKGQRTASASPWKVAQPGPLQVSKLASKQSLETAQPQRSSTTLISTLRPLSVQPTSPQPSKHVSNTSSETIEKGHKVLKIPIPSGSALRSLPPSSAQTASSQASAIDASTKTEHRDNSTCPLSNPPGLNEHDGKSINSKEPLPIAQRQSELNLSKESEPKSNQRNHLPLNKRAEESKLIEDKASKHEQSKSSLPGADELLPPSQLDQSKGAFQQVKALRTTAHGFTPPSSGSSTSLASTSDVPVLLNLLPDDIAVELSDPARQRQLTDIILDKGRQPVVWVSGVREFLGGEHRIVTADDIHSIVEKLGGFGNSNRVGLDQQLHSVSAIRNRKNDIIGLSMRVGRHISGIATMISDLLFSDPTKSILLLGEPSSGKTTILREITRLLAKESDVMIVDTVNEIAGDGDVPHPSVGQARRMMVPSLQEQGSIMMECVQNHSPEVMVVDKLSNSDEVAAALAVKDSGTRIIASMNGNLTKLVKNTKLQGLMGVETVVLGQSLAPNAVGAVGSLCGRSVLHRTGTPGFDLVVELRPETRDEWKIVLNTSDAVDKILQGGKCQYQHRIRAGDGGYVLKEEDT